MANIDGVMMDATLTNFERLLSSRIEIEQQELSSLRDHINALSTQVKYAKERMGIRYKESIEDVDATIQQVEYQHAIQSQTNASDREFMRLINQLRQKKKDIVEFNIAQRKLDEMKAKLNELLEERRVKEKSLEELYAGVRRVRSANRLGCDTIDIQEIKVTVPEEKLSYIIGRGGAQMRQIETESRALIDVENRGNGASIRLVGNAEAIASASAAIQSIVETSIEEWGPGEPTLACLLTNKAALLQEISTQYDVKIDLHRGKGLCKLTGLDAAVVAAKKAIESIDSHRVEVQFTADLLPLLLGKGGGTIRSFEEDGKVSVDVNREACKLVVQGMRPNVIAVSTNIRNLLSENKEIEETITANKQFCFEHVIGSGGHVVRNLQQEMGVSITIPKEGAVSDFDPMVVTIRGPISKVVPAKVRLWHMWETYSETIDEMEVPANTIALIVGKKGAKMAALRERYPDVNVNIQGTRVRIQSKVADERQAVRSAIQLVVDENYSAEYKMSSVLAIALKTSKGVSTRDALGQIGVFFEITSDVEPALIEVRGLKFKVDGAFAILDHFVRENYYADLTLDREDCLAVQVPPGKSTDSVIVKLSNEFDVNIQVIRKDNVIRVFGSQDRVEACIATMKQYLEGDISRGSLLLPVPIEAVSTVVGKAGANITKFEQDHHVKVDILKSKGLLRVVAVPQKATDSEAAVSIASEASIGAILRAAKYALKNIVADIRTTSVVDLSTIAAEVPEASAINRLATAVRSLFLVDAVVEGSAVTLKGLISDVQEAHAHILQEITGRGVFVVRMNSTRLDRLSRCQSFQSLKVNAVSRSVDVSLNHKKGTVNICAEVAAAERVRAELYRLLDSEFPSEFMSEVMATKAMRELATYRKLNMLENQYDVILHADRSMSCVRVCGDVEAVTSVTNVLRAQFEDWERRHKSLDIESFMLQQSFGLLNSITAIEKSTRTNIRVNRSQNRLDIGGVDVQGTDSAVEQLTALIAKIRSERWSQKIPTEYFGAFIGKAGANIGKIREDSGATLNTEKDSGICVVTGSAEQVAKAKELIESFLTDQIKKSFKLELPFPLPAAPLIIGAKGATIKDIQEKTGCRMDIDSVHKKVVFRGVADSCRAASDMVTAILEKEGFGAAALAAAEAKAKADAQAVDATAETSAASPAAATATAVTKTGVEKVVVLPPKLPPGASPALVARLLEAEVSRSAVRRRRRKYSSSETEAEDSLDSVYDYVEPQPVLASSSAASGARASSPIRRASSPIRASIPTGWSSSLPPAVSGPPLPSIRSLSAPRQSAAPTPAVVPVAVKPLVPSAIAPPTLVPALEQPLVQSKLISSASAPTPIAQPSVRKPALTTAAASPAGGYFKSKSGISIRL